VADEAELQDAVFEFQQYLSDHKPPLMVADSIDLLLRRPPAFVAAQIQAWVGAQPLTAPVSDYLYHGARKIWTVAELDLLPKEHVAAYVKQLTPALLTYCPDVDRDLLRENLERLGQAIAQPQAGPTVLHRQPGEAAPPAAQLPASSERGLSREVRRLSLLLEHLRPLAATSAPPEKRSEMASQFMTVAAVQSQTPVELDKNLAPLRTMGIDTGTEQVFRTLAASIAGWLLPRVEGYSLPAVSSQQLSAMRQIVTTLSSKKRPMPQRFITRWRVVYPRASCSSRASAGGGSMWLIGIRSFARGTRGKAPEPNPGIRAPHAL